MAKAYRLQKSHKPTKSHPHKPLDPPPPAEFDVPLVRPLTTRLSPLNERQRQHIASIEANILTIATGKAGTGKTYLNTAWAAIALREKRIKHIILTRPAVSAYEEIGFLKGDAMEKMAPYMAPYIDVLEEYLGYSFVEYCLKPNVGKIKVVPMAFLQGRTFNDSVVLLDEAQNTGPLQMELLLYRTGLNSKILVSGDMRQQCQRGDSGLEDMIYKVRGDHEVGWIKYEIADVVRSPFVQRMMTLYEAPWLEPAGVFAP